MAGTKRDAEEFAGRWKGRGNEEQETQLFWIDLFQNVLGLDDALGRLKFETPVQTAAGKSSGFIDVLVPTAKTIVEQKSLGIDLDKPEPRQGQMVTPAQQALAYAQGMPLAQQPRYVVACNFGEARVYDRNVDPLCRKPLFALRLEDLPKNLPAIQFLAGGQEAPSSISEAVSVKAGQIMGRLHDLAAASFDDPDAPENHHALSVLMTRLMFLMFCEDCGLVPVNGFRDYVQHYPAEDLRKALLDLFVWLDTPDGERDRYASDLLKALPYMDGGLFRERTEVPPLSEDFRTTLIVDGCQEFDWSGVSPTVFGSIFEGALSHDQRRANGQHFTSPENIHKVIDPLFLDDLEREFEEAKSKPVAGGARTKALQELHERIGSISVLDPAAGSGNFLTESYLCLRRLENRILFELASDGQASMSFEEAGDQDVLVSLASFHGIELEDFACCVARTALWIAEKQADDETAKVTKRVYEALPLTDYDNIIQGNALRMDWNDVVPASEVTYVCGNPPFLGGMQMSREQKAEMKEALSGLKGFGELDYVCAWYAIAARYVGERPIMCAFVSTNSICQGLAVGVFWRYMKEELGVDIDFAYRTFIWNSEATDQAHVHCVIVGFSHGGMRSQKLLFEGEEVTVASHINGYLFDADDVYVRETSVPLCDVPEMRFGSMPRSKGFTLTPDQRSEIIKRYPNAEKWIRPYWGADEFLKRKERYCLWLVNADPYEVSQCPPVAKRVEQVRDERAASKAEATRKLAETPMLFAQIAQPEGDGHYLLVPGVSSEKRPYIPIGFVSNEVIASNATQLVPGASLYHFGVMSSQFHNAWMRMVAGRLEMRYRYSKDLVYNTFIWPDPTADQRAVIERCAQEVLDARDEYPEAPLGSIYSNLELFTRLFHAHKALDAAVEAAYGVDFGGDEEKIVAHLFELYAERTKGE